MRTEQEKGASEIAVFADFVRVTGLPYVLASVEKRVQPEPDILCTHETEGPIAFELVEICDPHLAQFCATVSEGGAYYIRTGDPSGRIINKKLRRRYETSYPIELLCFTAGQVVTPANIIIPTIRLYMAAFRHAFRRAWLLSPGKAYEVWG